MCLTCVAQYVNEGGAGWPEITPLMQETQRLIGELRVIPYCGTGGPLHVTTDDTNVDDDNIASCWNGLESWADEWADEQTPEERDKMLRVCGAICWGLSWMTPAERAVAVELDAFQPGGGTFRYPPLGLTKGLERSDL